MSKEVILKANEKITPIIENIGYEVVDIEYKKVFDDMNLTFFIYKKGGITIEDCEKVNKALEEPLETYDITNGKAYNLNISSPGLDRPIKTDRDLARSMDTEIEISLIQPINKKKKIIGTLIGYEDNIIQLNIKGKTLNINRNNIKLIKPFIKI